MSNRLRSELATRGADQGYSRPVQVPTRAFHNPHTGERITLLAVAAETGGELTRMEIRVRPGPADWVGPDHFHPVQEERFEVVSGTPIFRVEGKERTGEAGRRGHRAGRRLAHLPERRGR